MNHEKLLKIETSTWLKTDTNEFLIIFHIPSEIVKSPVFEIIPYPDENNNILTEKILDKYFLYEDKIFNKETGKIVIDECINGIIRKENATVGSLCCNVRAWVIGNLRNLEKGNWGPEGMTRISQGDCFYSCNWGKVV